MTLLSGDVTQHLTTNCFLYTLELNIYIVVLVQSVLHRKQVIRGGKETMMENNFHFFFYRIILANKKKNVA